MLSPPCMVVSDLSHPRDVAGGSLGAQQAHCPEPQPTSGDRQHPEETNVFSSFPQFILSHYTGHKLHLFVDI